MSSIDRNLSPLDLIINYSVNSEKENIQSSHLSKTIREVLDQFEHQIFRGVHSKEKINELKGKIAEFVSKDLKSFPIHKLLYESKKLLDQEKESKAKAAVSAANAATTAATVVAVPAVTSATTISNVSTSTASATVSSNNEPTTNIPGDVFDEKFPYPKDDQFPHPSQAKWNEGSNQVKLTAEENALINAHLAGFLVSVNPNAFDELNGNENPLSLALKFEDFNALDNLLAAAPENRKKEYAELVLRFAASPDDLSAARDYHEYNQKLLKITFKHGAKVGATALAAATGDISLLEKCLTKKQSQTILDSALIAAINNQRLSCAKMLLAAGADILSCQYALHHARRFFSNSDSINLHFVAAIFKTAMALKPQDRVKILFFAAEKDTGLYLKEKNDPAPVPVFLNEFAIGAPPAPPAPSEPKEDFHLLVTLIELCPELTDYYYKGGTENKPLEDYVDALKWREVRSAIDKNIHKKSANAWSNALNT